MTRMKSALTLAAALLIAACATSSYQGVRPATPGTKIAGSQVVVYSFLEGKSHFFGEAMVRQLHVQLLQRLAERGVTARLVVYKSDEAPSATTAKHFTAMTETVVVPLRDYLRTQRAEETRHADKYRLLVMPWLMTAQQSTDYSRIDWTLTEIATEQPVWFANQNTSRTVILNRDEAPESRASHFVDGIVAQMSQSGLFGAETDKK